MGASEGLVSRNVGGVGIESGSEIDQQKAHLMYFAAKMFAGQPMAKFMNGADGHKQEPEDPDVVSSFTFKGIKGLGVGLNMIPIAGDQVQGGYKQKDGENHETGSEHPTQIGVQLG